MDAMLIIANDMPIRAPTLSRRSVMLAIVVGNKH